MPRMRWRPTAPRGHCIKAIRVVDGVETTAYVGYVAEAKPKGDKVSFRAEGPEGLLLEIPFPFEAPGVRSSGHPDGFRHWWRQIHYIFDLPDPSLVPPLPATLQAEGLEMVQRFITTTQDLADADVLSDHGKVTVNIDDDTDEEHVAVDFPKRDIQMGFAVLLRQCQGREDEARYDAVFEILRRAADAANDDRASERLEQLYVWNGAVRSLRKKSLNQMVRDRFVAEEGWRVWDYQEELRPEERIRRFNYGDLIHWGRTKGDIPSAEDEYEAAEARSQFFAAALGLAHLTIGFGEVARSLTTPLKTIWTPLP